MLAKKMKTLITLSFLFFFSFSSFTQNKDFLVTTSIKIDNNTEYSFESLKNNLSFCYMITDKIMTGVTMSDATTELKHADGFENIVKTAADMQILGRYYHTKEFFAQLTVPFNSDVENISATELLQLGGGHSVNVWNNFYIEAYYAMLIKKDVNSDRKGAWYVGLSYRF